MYQLGSHDVSQTDSDVLRGIIDRLRAEDGGATVLKGLLEEKDRRAHEDTLWTEASLPATCRVLPGNVSSCS
jgi:hypothetical protein